MNKDLYELNYDELIDEYEDEESEYDKNDLDFLISNYNKLPLSYEGKVIMVKNLIINKHIPKCLQESSFYFVPVNDNNMPIIFTDETKKKFKMFRFYDNELLKHLCKGGKYIVMCQKGVLQQWK